MTIQTTKHYSHTVVIILLITCCHSNIVRKRSTVADSTFSDNSMSTNEQSNTGHDEHLEDDLPGLFNNTTNQTAGLQPALLDYENETIIEKLEETVVNDDTTLTLDLPPNVYEVHLQDWTEESHHTADADDTNDVDYALRGLIRESLVRAESNRHVRHNSNHPMQRGISAAGNRPMRDEPVVNLPVGNINNEVLEALETRQRGQSSPNPLSRLIEQDTFNMTVDYQQPFHNVDRPKLLEIVLLMRSDCTLLPKRIVRWVSGKRGILFECQNGAWVVKYLKRRRRKPRPTSITDCHEIHAAGNLGDASTQHNAYIKYNDRERKTFTVFCQHDHRHTNHQLIDNHINVDPIEPARQQQQIAGAWTVIQRRENGQVKFYRSMRRYKRGFGRFDRGEYWLGLEALHEITHVRPYMLRVEITTKDNRTYYSEYDQIRVASEAKQYRLRLGDFIQPTEHSELSAGDFMSLHNRGKFHARDSEDFPVNCAKLYGTAFWFRGCWTAVNLNGPYNTDDPNNIGVRWATANPDEIRRVWKTVMMIKPIL